jgi:hypothetical protein
MTCNKSTLLKTALGLSVLFLAAYASFPAVRAGFLSFSPLPLSLLCPLSMLFCMKGMSKQSTTPAEPMPKTERQDQLAVMPNHATVTSDGMPQTAQPQGWLLRT